LADEPTGALDKESAEIVLAILKKIVENGKLVILVTHSEMVASHCSRIVRIDDGVVVEDSKKYDVKIKGEYEKTIMPRPIKVKDVANLSIRNLDRSRSRSLIVSIGMAIGITALVLILNLGLGLTNYVTDVYADALQTMQMTVTQSDGSSFSDDNLDNVVSIDGVDVVHTSSTIEDATYVYGDLDGDVASLSAFYSDYYPTILYGALPSQDGEMMINEAFALLLTEDGIITSVGTQITLTYDDVSFTYTITGIYDDPTDSSDVANAYLTHDDLTTIEGGTLDINTLYITLDDVTYIESVKDDLKSLDFETFQVDNSANQVLSYIDLGTKVLTGVAMISMIVAAIMIFIVLYISIVERTKEIGILRAIGARKKDIRRMFLVEAGVLGFVGGIFGVVFSLAITILTNTVTSISLQTTLISYGVQNYFLGLVVSIIVSLLAGIAPAVKAADMDPVVSLRYE
ncbi:MAG: ABC transporter permease, partial [Candidatus Izemoplasmatales bacterium]|nr:ABC transporter permease [Candidatus Izemoplasmatales bacterium]